MTGPATAPNPERAHTGADSTPLWPWLVLLALAVALYFFGLGSFYAPTNGDEMVYIHIARLTAEAGQWLPLVSDLGNMRNTKPPLLFWQAMVAGDWGAHWTLFALRLPSVVYTLLTAAAVAWFTQRLRGNWRTGLLAAVLYLAFFSSFRYGRVYLTSAPETFWLALPMWTLLWSQLRSPSPAGSAWAGAKALFNGKRWAHIPAPERTLWLWLLVWLVIFSLPSQRSARYVIPAMPALAMLLALHWERVARLWFLLTLAITSTAVVLLGRFAWVMGDMDIGPPALRWAAMLAVAVGLAAALAGCLRREWSRTATLLACLGVYAIFGLMVAPLDSARAQYSPAAVAQLQGKRVAVPNGFTGQYERFHFFMPHSTLVPFDVAGRNTGALHPEMPPAERLAFLLASFDAVVWLDNDSQATAPSCAPTCRVLGYRWHVKSRHKSGEVTLANVWYPQQWLFGREWLLLPGAAK